MPSKTSLAFWGEDKVGEGKDGVFVLLHATYLPDTSSILLLLLLVILCVGVVIVIRREKSSSARAGYVLCKLSNMSRGSIVAFLGFRPVL